MAAVLTSFERVPDGFRVGIESQTCGRDRDCPASWRARTRGDAGRVVELPLRELLLELRAVERDGGVGDGEAGEAAVIAREALRGERVGEHRAGDLRAHAIGHVDGVERHAVGLVDEAAGLRQLAKNLTSTGSLVFF